MIMGAFKWLTEWLKRLFKDMETLRRIPPANDSGERSNPTFVIGFKNPSRLEIAMRDVLYTPMLPGHWYSRPGYRTMPPGYRLSEAQIGIIKTVGNAGGGPILYQTVLETLGIPLVGKVHGKDRRPLESFGLLVYGNRQVMLTDSGFDFYLGLLTAEKVQETVADTMKP